MKFYKSLFYEYLVITHKNKNLLEERIYMNNRKNIGNIGEDVATRYLEKLGYKILERNFRCKSGEIDIIAQDKDEIVFIEVKTRKVLSYGDPAESVNEPKQKHIYKAGEYYLFINDSLDSFIRIDVVEVYVNNDNYEINHIKKAIIDSNL